MLQVLITNKDAAQIQFTALKSGGSTLGSWISPVLVSPSVNGQRYDVSIYINNSGPGNATVTSSIPNSPSVTVNPTSQWVRVKFTVIGDGVTNLQLILTNIIPNVPVGFLAALAKVNRSNIPTENLIPTSSLDISTDWNFSGASGHIVTAGQSRTFDYTQYVGQSSLTIDDKLNQPAQCQFILTNNDDTFIVPSREAYVQVFSKQFNKYVFTGFISSDIQKDFVGLNSTTPTYKFQTYRFSISATSDEYLLGQKTIPMLPPMVNMGAGQILAYLANVLAPGFFDVTSKCASGDLVPYMEYDPNKNWIQTAKTLADQFRYRVKILNKVLYYQPWGDQACPISYDDTLNQRLFDPSKLQTTIYDTTLVNDVFVIGDAEASDNHEDYFVGDGFTSNFPLRYTAFETDSALLLKEDWSQNSIDTSKWVIQDPVNTVTLVGALNINGGTNNFGETYQYLRSGIDFGSNVILEHGEIFFVGNCSGAIIGGVYDNANTFAEVNGSGQCEFGFDIRPASGFVVSSSVSGTSGLQIQPRRLGQLVGTPVITQQNHYYILRTIVNGKSNNRYTSTFKSFTGAIISGGSNNAVADITWVISDINLNNTNPNQPGFVNTQPPITDTRFTLRGQTVPAFGLYVLYNIKNANLTIQWTQIFDPPKASLSAAGLSGVSGGQLPLIPSQVGVPLDYELGFGLGRQVATVGNSQSGGAGGASDGTGSVLQFYSDSIPGVGSRIRLQAWESQTAIARVQDPVSIAKEASVVGDDGHRMTFITDFKPLPRSSEECELAGKATLLDRTNTIYQGSYGPIVAGSLLNVDSFFDFKNNDYPRPGTFFNINSPQRGITNLQVLLSEVKINYTELMSEQANVTINFGPTLFAENLLAGFVPRPENTLMPKDTAVQPTPIQLANVGQVFAGDLETATLTTAQNLLLFSEQLDNSIWIQTLIGAGTNATITPNVTIDPFGNLTADKITFPAFGTSNDGCRINQKVLISVPSVGSFYTFSIWLRADSPTVARIYLKKDSATGTSVSSVTTINVTTSWKRYTISGDASTSNTTALVAVLDGFGPNSAITIYAWGAQLEIGQLPTGYFKTVSTSGFVPGLGFNGSNAYFDLGSDPITGVEVRRTNFGWGQNNNDRLGFFTNRVFTMPRTQFDQSWYLRQINGSLISRRSKVIRIAAPIVPAPPLILDADSQNIQANFNGDVRNIYGIELRGPDNTTIIKQNAVASIQDLLFNLPKLNAGRFWNASNNLLLFTEEFNNPVWAPTLASIVTDTTANPFNSGNNADQINFSAKGTNSNAGIFQTVNIPSLYGQPSVIAGMQLTFSVWLKVSGGTQNIELAMFDSPQTTFIGPNPGKTVSVNTVWQRYSTTGIVGPGTNNAVTVAIRLPFANASGLAQVLAWGAQLEVGGSNPTNYVVNVDSYGPKNLLQATEEFDNQDFWLQVQNPSVTGGFVQVPIDQFYNEGLIVPDGLAVTNGINGKASGVGLSDFGYSSNVLGGSFSTGGVINVAGVSFQLGPTFMITDTFPGSALSSQWTLGAGTFTVAANQVQGATFGTGGRGLAVRNDQNYSNDQTAQAAYAVVATNNNTVGVAVRANAAQNSYYGAYNDNATIFIFKFQGGNVTVLNSTARVPVVNDIIRLSVVGNVLSLHVNGTLLLTATDNSLSSGSPGIISNSAGPATVAQLKNFFGGNSFTGTYSGGNAMYVQNQVVPVVPNFYTSLRFLATAFWSLSGTVIPITVTYTDGTSQLFNQTINDNGFQLQSIPNEIVAINIGKINNANGTTTAGNRFIYEYRLAVDSTRKVRSIKFGSSNINVQVFAISAVVNKYQTVVTPNVVVDPSLGNNLTADRIDFAPRTSSQTAQLIQFLSPAVVQNKAFNFSVWLRTSGGSVSGDIFLQDFPATQNAGILSLNLTSQWQRISVSGAFNNTANPIIAVGIGLPFGFASGAQQLLAWGAQLEYGNNPTLYLGNGNVFRQFALYFFNTMWDYSNALIAQIASPPSPVVTLGNKLSNLIELRLDQLSGRDDIRYTIAQLSNDGSFLSVGTINVTGSGQPATFNLNVTNAAGSGFFARARRTDYFGDGSWSSPLFIPPGNIVASTYMGGQGSIPPTLSNIVAALFTYTASALAGGGANTGRIIVTWPNFTITFPDGSTQFVTTGSYDTGTVLTSSQAGTTPYIFYIRIAAQIPGSQPEFVNGAHTSQNSADAQACMQDGYLALGGSSLSVTFNVPQANAPGGGTSGGGGSGGGDACLPLEDLTHSPEGEISVEDLRLGTLTLGLDPVTMEEHWGTVDALAYGEELCVTIELEDGATGRCSIHTENPVWEKETDRFKLSFRKPREYGYKTFMFSKKSMKLVRVKSIRSAGSCKVGKVTILPIHTIFCGDILMHNGFVPKR